MKAYLAQKLKEFGQQETILTKYENSLNFEKILLY